MQTERILVTGGAGFIGSNLVNELRNRGHLRIAAVRNDFISVWIPSDDFCEIKGLRRADTRSRRLDIPNA
jgi:nucleoside-diphosphate-sugar epimerase